MRRGTRADKRTQYFEAVRLIDNGMSRSEAIKTAGISDATFAKYRAQGLRENTNVTDATTSDFDWRYLAAEGVISARGVSARDKVTALRELFTR